MHGRSTQAITIEECEASGSAVDPRRKSQVLRISETSSSMILLLCAELAGSN